MTKLYSLLWGKCIEALQQGLSGHEDFEDKYISFDAKWLLHQIKLKTQGIKEQRHSHLYEYVYKLIRKFLNVRQAEDESCVKFLKRFLDLSSPLKLSGTNMTTHINLIDMKYKNLVKADPNKSTALAKKDSTSSSSEAQTSMGFLSSSDYNRLISLITDLRQDMLKRNNSYPRNVTSAYYIPKRFQLAYPRRHHTKRTGDKWNR